MGRQTGQSIPELVVLSRLVSEEEVVVGKKKGPAGLTTIEVLSGFPKLEITMIGDDFERLRESFQELTPILESFCDGKHLTIVDLVVSLSLSHRLGAIRDRVPELILTVLRDNSSSGESRCVHLDASFAIGGPDCQNGFGCESRLQGVESLLLLFSSDKGYVLLGEVVKRSTDLREVLDETAVEVGKPDEASKLLQVLGYWPVDDCFYFDRVHGDFSMTND